MTLARLREVDWSAFEHVGYVVLRSFASGEELQALAEESDRVMLGQAAVDYDELTMELDEAYTPGFRGPSLAYRRIQGLERVPAFRAYLDQPFFRDLCARAYGRDASIAVFRLMLLNKPAFSGVDLGWHQDYWTYLDRQPVLTTWLALDPATNHNGCLRVVPRSHALGHINDDDVSGFLTSDMTARLCPEADVVDLRMQAGDLAVLHNGLLHSSRPNGTGDARRALSACYLRGDTRDVRSGQGYPLVFGNTSDETPRERLR